MYLLLITVEIHANYSLLSLAKILNTVKPHMDPMRLALVQWNLSYMDPVGLALVQWNLSYMDPMGLALVQWNLSYMDPMGL